jgi:hypothetical protein
LGVELEMLIDTEPVPLTNMGNYHDTGRGSQ